MLTLDIYYHRLQLGQRFTIKYDKNFRAQQPEENIKGEV